MYLDWFQLVLIYIVTNSASKVIQKQVLKDQEVDPAAFSAFFLFVVGVLSIPLLMLEKPSIASSPELWLVVILSSVFYTVCMFLYYNALKSTEVSQVETIATTPSIWFLVFGIFLFVLLSAVFQMISTLALYAAYKYDGDLSVVGPLAQTSTVLTIIVGIVILKERWNLKRKIIGVILVLVGVALLKLSI